MISPDCKSVTMTLAMPLSPDAAITSRSVGRARGRGGGGKPAGRAEGEGATRGAFARTGAAVVLINPAMAERLVHRLIV